MPPSIQEKRITPRPQQKNKTILQGGHLVASTVRVLPGRRRHGQVKSAFAQICRGVRMRIGAPSKKLPQHHNPVPLWNAGVVQEGGESIRIAILDIGTQTNHQPYQGADFVFADGV